MSEEAFESCLIAYTRLTNNTDVLYEQDTVKVITIQGMIKVFVLLKQDLLI